MQLKNASISDGDLLARPGYPVLDLLLPLPLNHLVQNYLQVRIHFLSLLLPSQLHTHLPYLEFLLNQAKYSYTVLVIYIVLERIESSSKSAFLEEEVALALVPVDEKDVFKGKAVFRFDLSIWVFKGH